MSYPFIIWTMQRTGGTSLTDLLMAMSEHKSAEHEPFNRDRQFGAVTVAWSTTKDTEGLSRALADIIGGRYLIKHTYELRDMHLNIALIAAAAGTEYRHLFLYRRDELARLVSKFVAEANGTWFQDYATRIYAKVRGGDRKLGPLPVERVVAAYRRAHEATKDMRRALAEFGVDLHEVAYEDIYVGDPAARLARLSQLFEFLGFSPDEIARHRPIINEKILGGGQNTRSIAHLVPNFVSVVDAVRRAGYVPVPGGLGADSMGAGAVSSRAAPDGPQEQSEFPEGRRHRALVGGLWDEIGGLQLEFLKSAGLEPHHCVLDIGCGCLRAGVKIVPYLEPNHYYGIDPNKKLLDVGYREELVPIGLGNRLSRKNLCSSAEFEHRRLAENTIDFGICAAVFTRLPIELLDLLLENTAKYFRVGGKLYVSFFEAARESADGTPSRYHYSQAEMLSAAEGTPWRARYIGEWNHPRGQKMMEYERI